MFEWTDPDTNEVYEIFYNVTQTDDEGPEHFMWRRKSDTHGVHAWMVLPPFVCHNDMREIEDHFFGPTQGWQHGIPASIVSDIERIDKALDGLIDASSTVERENSIVYEPLASTIADALHDARSGLLFLSEKLTGRKSGDGENDAP